MKVLDPSHRYLLDNLFDFGEQTLQFYKDPKIHGEGQHQIGTSCQEVIRALIDRVQTLHMECPAPENAFIISGLRQAIVGFEARALRRMAEKGMPIELLPVKDNGHIVNTEQLL